MRGNPRIEWILVLVFSGLLAWPLFGLTRRAPPTWYADVSLLPEGSTATPVWLDLRFSHAPESFRITWSEEVLWEGGGFDREDEDLLLQKENGRVLFSLEIVWPEDLNGAYTEISLEPENLPRKSQGFWSRGNVQRNLEFSWPNPAP
ncbi:MAG: hypothetical protein JJU29_05970 [Verrucomicrobia bacterium]|nr:hypothetical protein [Verrucomicrobiota bacterium]MCH8511860.1 hypothetical protein [Kiritimatiellia bacterium]